MIAIYRAARTACVACLLAILPGTALAGSQWGEGGSLRAESFPAQELTPSDLGPGTVVFDLSHDEMVPLFMDGQIVEVDGVQIGDNGCTFPVRMQAAPDEAPQGQVSVAVNYSNCRALLMTGHLSRLPDRIANRPSSTKQIWADPASRRPLEPGEDAVTASCRSGSLDIWQTDPVNFTVTSTTTIISWCYDFSSVTSCASTDDWSWFTPSGWYLISGPSNWATLVDQWNCKGDTYMLVGNDSFWCGARASTRTSYSYNEMWGNYYGAYWVGIGTAYSTWGVCSDLLTFHSLLQAGPPS